MIMIIVTMMITMEEKGKRGEEKDEKIIMEAEEPQCSKSMRQND